MVKEITRIIASTILLLILLPATAGSQQNQNNQPVAVAEEPTAPIILDGRVLFRLRGIPSYPAEERVRVIRDRIKSVAADEKVSIDDLRIVESQSQTDIVAGEYQLIAIVDADGVLEGVQRDILAQVYEGKIADAIKTYRQERTRSALLLKVIYSAGALVLSAVLLYLIIRLSRWLVKLMDARIRTKMQGVRIQSFQLVQAEQLWLAVRGILYMVRTLLLLAVILGCVEYVLGLYPWTRFIAQRSIALILNPLRLMSTSIMQALPDLIFIAILALIVRYTLKLARLFFAGMESGTVKLAGFDREWASPTFKILRFLIIAFAVVVAYPYIPGAGSEAFKGVSIFIGVIFSLGSTSIVSNTIAGYSMTYRRLFRIGDRVQIGDHLGDVEQIRLQVTHMRSLKNEEIILPNSVILNSHVVNYSSLAKDQGLILHTTVGIGYETPWRQVESMLLNAAERTPELLRQPPPFVLQKALGDFCVVYEINAYCDRPQESSRLYTELHRNILDVFNEYGVQIMTPAYVADSEKPKVVPRDKWFEAPAFPPTQDEEG